ncbi:hypothetical protein K439DRAFT_1615607 [Ramaria rubella]|nr:hypothetical protein K439DRAFT_1615607 [Ramaria rubella]
MPVIGTIFLSLSVQPSDILILPDSDPLPQDLATLVSYPGVILFKSQDLSVNQLKEFGTQFGELLGKSQTSMLHKHPISKSLPNLGVDISIISFEGHVTKGIACANFVKGSCTSNGWHSYITFECVPSDYTGCIYRLYNLKLTIQLPADSHMAPVGGNTLGSPLMGIEMGNGTET